MIAGYRIASMLSGVVHFGGPHLGGKFVEHTIDVFVTVDTAERFGQLDRLVDHDLVWNLDMVVQLERTNQQSRMLDRGQLIYRTINQRRQAGTQRIGLLDRAVQQYVEMLGVGFVKTVRLANMSINRTGIFIVQ